MPSAASTTARVLVVDDEPDLRTLYEMTLLREGHQVDCAADLAQARELLRAQHYDLLITDMRLPDGLGLALLHQVQQQAQALSQDQAQTGAGSRPKAGAAEGGRASNAGASRCLVITAHGSAENAVEALKAGAFDYLTKPVDLRQLRALVAAALAGRLDAPGRAGEAAAASDAPADAARDTRTEPGRQALARLVGESAGMRQVKDLVARVAPGMAPVLVRGESGTGKELVARAIHACSHRAAGPFVAVNCGAIPEALLEAEFFGARRGAYTGATQDRVGYFQAAQGGTLFLDEIGDLPLAMQSKLLRAIQERRVRALGQAQEDAVDARIVSATHKDLAAEVRAGRFRQDLYYRLDVIEIALPPLRERREDLPALCQALLARVAHDSALPAPPVDEALLRQLAGRDFPGNVRELENLLHRAMALGLGEAGPLALSATPAAPSEGRIEGAGAALAPDAPVRSATDQALPTNLQDWLDTQEREMLVRALRETGFNRTAAAQRLGLKLRQMRYRIARLDIQVPGADEHEPD